MMYGYGRYEPPPPPPPENLYDLLAGIIARTPWRSEAEAKKWQALLENLRELNIFGYLAQTITTEDKQT